ncbi:hypothetical protein FH972_000503 [Carpinus fangiana]|uniref:Uncharacterized protein n=1 Tax=Carpinus fangiana TaxID=176857 RepID=A0A5N6QBZ7_9ROSI|nr:hypothetical protein FH972_000503 [Carpinus fangiana]
MQDGHERGFDQHGIAKEVRSKLDMASPWQYRPRVNHPAGRSVLVRNKHTKPHISKTPASQLCVHSDNGELLHTHSFSNKTRVILRTQEFSTYGPLSSSSTIPATSTSQYYYQAQHMSPQAACDSHVYTLSGFSEIGLYLACQTRNHMCFPKSEKEC